MITLLSNGCPQCNSLKQMLERNKTPYILKEITTEQAIELGFSAMPMVQLENGNYINYIESIKYLRTCQS